jgi:hypothetical protein
MDRLNEIAYTELVIVCERDGCNDVFAPCLDDPATEPVEVWANMMGKRARTAGWTTSAEGRVVCPRHVGTD